MRKLLSGIAMLAFAASAFLPITAYISAPGIANAALPLLPDKTLWEQNMITYGNQWGQYWQSHPNDIGSAYYDGEWIAYQISDYTGQKSPWYDYARAAEIIYRDNYYRPDNYSAPGYERFPHGLYEDYIRSDTNTVNKTTITDIRSIRDNPAFSKLIDLECPDNSYCGYRARMAREVAYAMHANITAEKAGELRMLEAGTQFGANEPRVKWFVAFMENHLWEYKNNTYQDPVNSGGYFQPFMSGLTMHALIDFYEWEKANGRDPNAYWPKTRWATILDAIADFTNWMYNTAVVHGGPHAGQKMWVPCVDTSNYPATACTGTGYGWFRYADYVTNNESGTIADTSPAPDLNLLIAPAFAWVYKQTGNVNYITWGDNVWQGGVRLAAVDWNGKIFDQNYRWSFKYVQWRNEGEQIWEGGTPSPSPSVSPSPSPSASPSALTWE